jgi:hypothetical protein
MPSKKAKKNLLAISNKKRPVDERCWKGIQVNSRIDQKKR